MFNSKKKKIKDYLTLDLKSNLSLMTIHSALATVSEFFDDLPRHEQKKFEELVVAWLVSSICHKHPKNHWPDHIELTKITDEVISVVERSVENIAAHKRIKEKESLR